MGDNVVGDRKFIRNSIDPFKIDHVSTNQR